MKIVISGVNLIEGGPLKVFQDAISALAMLTGEKVSEIVLENVFSNFCVGK